MARCETYLVLTSEEVNARIPYALVCMTRFGAHWETGRRRRRWLEEFTEQERTAATRLFNQSHRWLLTTGVPDTVRMTVQTFALSGCSLMRLPGRRTFAFIRNCRHAWPRPRLRVFRVILYYISKPNARKKRDAAKAASRLHAGILI